MDEDEEEKLHHIVLFPGQEPSGTTPSGTTPGQPGEMVQDAGREVWDVVHREEVFKRTGVSLSSGV